MRKKQAVVKVLSDETDVFVLLCSNIKKINCSSTKLYTDAFKDNNKIIIINRSVATNETFFPSLIALHALSGCDSVPMMFGIDKSKNLKAVSKVSLKYIGDVNAI